MPALSEKQLIRSRMLENRRSRPVTERAAADAALVAALLSVVRTNRARTVAAYAPMKNEPGGPDLPAQLAGTGVAVLLPVLLDDRDLDWARYPGGTPLGVAAIATADLVVVPAVAVDRTGVRLGRGGGSYDRALARVGAATPVIALLYDGELLPALPAEPHDRRVRAVIMPATGVVYLPTSAGRTAPG